MHRIYVPIDGIDPRLAGGRARRPRLFDNVRRSQLEREVEMGGEFFISIADNPLKSPDSGK